MSAPKTPTKKIFLSYKGSDPKDRQSATEIKRLLENVSREASSAAVQVFVSESLQAGASWRTDILKALRESDYLIFLYTDRFAHWEWCHFEIGLFLQGSSQGREEEEKDIFCIYPKAVGDPPSPLSDFQ